MEAFELGYPRTELRRELVALVLVGAKRATSSLREPGESPPAVGTQYVLRGYDDEPAGVVEVTEARVLPVSEIDLQFVRDEGEGYESVEDWRLAHEQFFQQPLAPDTEIVAVRFKVVDPS
jgi:uncharacterized protein YhfF